ncbi:MAG: branched-chain amino acid ABC transporter permease, partial [bacterium]|nr:branched-chain amino acid ABC transporter permease [bacterium]
MAEYFVLQALNGLVTGLIYALIAAGLTIIFSVLKIVNFGHGALYMLGGYAGYYAINFLGIPPVAAVLAAMAAMFVVGVIFERLMLGPLYTNAVDRKDEYAIIVTFALFMVLENAAIVVFGPFNKRPPSFVEGSVHLGLLTITDDRLVAAAFAAILLIGLSLFMRHSSIGQALDAVSQSRDSAAIIGIDAQRMYS